MLYHTYYKGGEESHLTYYYYFVVIFFVTGVPQTLTPCCGCSFAITSFHYSLRAMLAEAFDGVCVVSTCVDVCMPCVHFTRVTASRFRGFIYYSFSFLSTSRLLPRRARSIRKFKVGVFFLLESTAIRIPVRVNLGSCFYSRKKDDTKY